MSTHDELADAFERLLREHATPLAVRAIERQSFAGAALSAGAQSEATAAAAALWSQLNASGFLDALLPEAAGGAGLALREVCALVEACGRHALPLPCAESMFARAALAAAQLPAPQAPIALALAAHDGGTLVCRMAAHARTAHFALVELSGACYLPPCAQAEFAPLAAHSGAGQLRWRASILDGQRSLATTGLLHVQAALLAAQMAGAMDRLLQMTLEHANQREPFGKPIGKFQAVQHQISVLAEQTFLAHMAARMGCDADGPQPNLRYAAIAKAVTSEAATSVAAIAHALHGAIGMTAEFDLQLYTRRLHEWRLCAGAESYWQRELGAALLQKDAAGLLDFVRSDAHT